MNEEMLRQWKQIEQSRKEHELVITGASFVCMGCGTDTTLGWANNYAYYIDENGIKTLINAISWKDGEAVGKFIACSDECRSKMIRNGFLSFWQLTKDVVPKRYWNVTLESFNVDDEHLQSRYKNTNRWLESPELGLILRGAAGIGKTSLAVAIAHEFRKLEKTVVFENAVDLQIKLTTASKSYKPEVFVSTSSYYTNKDLIIFDDFDNLDITPDIFALVYSIFSKIWDDKKLLILTSNSNPEQLKKKLDPRIWSRINGMCKDVELKGNDLREPKNAI